MGCSTSTLGASCISQGFPHCGLLRSGRSGAQIICLPCVWHRYRVRVVWKLILVGLTARLSRKPQRHRTAVRVAEVQTPHGWAESARRVQPCLHKFGNHSCGVSPLCSSATLAWQQLGVHTPAGGRNWALRHCKSGRSRGSGGHPVCYCEQPPPSSHLSSARLRRSVKLRRRGKQMQRRRRHHSRWAWLCSGGQSRSADASAFCEARL